MKDKLNNWFGFIGSIGSIISVILLNHNEWSILQIILVTILSVSALISAYIIFFQKENHICRSKDEIRTFMKEWVATEGVVKIFSRDLSWVDDDEILTILKNKGEDLHLYVQSKEHDKVKQITSNNNCNVYAYGKWNLAPKSRFTIIHANKEDRQIALALEERRISKNKLHHEIYISTDKSLDKKLLGLAEDLIMAIECMGEKND